jgi:hypothetical protein
MSKKQKKSGAGRAEYTKALDELNLIRSSLDEAYDRFDHIVDPLVMDACIFEISALKSKYNYAVRNIKTFFI